MKKILLILLTALFLSFISACTNVNENNKNTYTVLFDSDGGTSVDKQEIVEGEKITKPTDPTKENYLFDGWFLGDEKLDFTTYKVSSNI